MRNSRGRLIHPGHVNVVARLVVGDDRAVHEATDDHGSRLPHAAPGPTARRGDARGCERRRGLAPPAERPGTPIARRRHRPPRARPIDAIVDSELQRALDDPDSLRGIARLVAAVRRVRARPRRGKPHQGARHRAHGPQAARRAARRRQRSPRGGVDVPAPCSPPPFVALYRDAFIGDEGSKPPSRSASIAAIHSGRPQPQPRRRPRPTACAG